MRDYCTTASSRNTLCVLNENSQRSSSLTPSPDRPATAPRRSHKYTVFLVGSLEHMRIEEKICAETFLVVCEHNGWHPDQNSKHTNFFSLRCTFPNLHFLLLRAFSRAMAAICVLYRTSWDARCHVRIDGTDWTEVSDESCSFRGGGRSRPPLCAVNMRATHCLS